MMTKKSILIHLSRYANYKTSASIPSTFFMALRQSIQILRIRILTLSSAILLYVRLFLKTTG